MRDPSGPRAHLTGRLPPFFAPFAAFGYGVGMVQVDLAEVFDAQPAACVVLTPDMRIVAMNRAYERLVGPRDRLLGRDVFEALPGGPFSANARCWRASVERVTAAKECDVLPVARYDLEVPDRPGEYEARYWSAITAPILDDDGRVVLLVHRTEDITAFVEHLRRRHPSDPHPPPGQEAVEAELYVRAQEVREINERLRDVQAQERRAAAALQETIRRQHREAAATRREVAATREEAATRQEVADASHDLRNPLAGLQTRLEAALADPEADSRQVLHAALEDAQRLSDIVSDLLELARLDAGAPVPTELIDLAELMRETLDRQSCRYAVAAHLDSTAVVHGSRFRLIRLLANLLANADRHARAGIEVSLATDDGQAVLQIIDDGPGIPADEREAVFRRFYRRADARRADPGGTGLGLSIARQTALAHHGTLHIADRPAGTCMVLRLPLNAPAPAEA